MLKLRIAGVLAGLAMSASFASSAHADVGVRVEGDATTLIARTAVSATGDRATSPSGNDCPGSSAIGALHRATAGDWDGSPGTVERILSETHSFDPNASANHYWTFWLNYEYQNAGACDTPVQDGDDVLFFVDCFGDCASPKPLRLEVPATARPGEAVPVKVTEYTVTFDQSYTGTTHASPSAGALVHVGERTYPTDANGIARVETATRGPVAMRATKADHVRSSTESVCVSDGADGFCGTSKPGDPAPGPSGPGSAGGGSTGAPGAAVGVARDTQHPLLTILAPANGQRLRRSAAPRVLRGLVAPDQSGVRDVKLRLTRRHRGRCWYFSPKSDAFVRTRCGRAFFFRIGDRADWSFLLPERPGPGRYVLDAVAIDKSFNRDTLARGRNRVVFTVR